MREDDIRPKALLDEFFEKLARDAERLAVTRERFVAVACPMCGSDQHETAFEKERFTYCLCSGCGSLFTSPRPSPESLRDYVAQSEAVEFWSTHFYRQTAEARRRQIFRPRAARIGELARQHGVGRSAVVADIGAGYGLFLQELTSIDAAARLVGIEPDPRLASICRDQGFTVVEQWVEDIRDGDVSADLATAFEVLEHVFDPVAFLSACARVVRPGGLLFFSTLTISGFDLQVLWEHSRSISPPQHINFPSTVGVAKLIERAGLEVVDVSTPGQLDVDIVRNRLTANPGLQVPRFARVIAESDDDTRGAFQRFLQAHKLSSHLQCVVRRPR